MQKSLFLTLISTMLLSACVVPTVDSNGGVLPIPIPVVITSQTPNTKSDDNRIYVCKLSAFTSQYRSENTHRGKARLDVKKQCLKDFHEMFCRDDDIKCDVYN